MRPMDKDPFRTRYHVPEFDDIVAEIRRRSAETRAKIPMVADVAYGADRRETLDLFFPEGRRNRLPVHIFIHGGYWRMFSKRDYSCIADTVAAAKSTWASLANAMDRDNQRRISPPSGQL